MVSQPSAVALWAIVAIPSLVQLAYPPLYDALSRQPELIRDGQWCRIVSSVVVQDGGLPGTLFNLAFLAVIAILAVPLWGPVRTFVLFVAGAVVFNLPVVFLSPSAGGGNSGATFFLATSMVGLLLVRRSSARVVLAAVVILVDGVVLLVLRDRKSVV